MESQYQKQKRPGPLIIFVSHLILRRVSCRLQVRSNLPLTVDAKYSRILSLDLSTKSGWAVFIDGILEKSGELEKVNVVNFNVNDKPWTQPEYPWNVMDAAHAISD